jgi:RNA polymerase-associated protein LEO1
MMGRHAILILQALERRSNVLQIYTMRVPDFLSIEAEEFNPETYVPPPYNVASTSLCWRKDPADDSQLQSNARFIKWDDGSITLQLASQPLEQYRIASKPLAPLTRSGEYDHKLDSHVYLAAGLETSQVFRLTSHVTHGLTVLPTTLETDDAVARLQEQLAAAARGSKQTAAGTAPIYDQKEDPELAARRAEVMEKEAIKAERRRQQLADREADRGRRQGASRTGPTGLSVGGLEDGGLHTTRPRAKPRRQNRRGEIFTDDEEEYNRGGPRNREDEYDEDDGFLVGSDEDVEEGEDDEEELEDEDMDAEGEDDEEVAPKARSKPEPKAGTPPARKKNRYVVDDEDDE